MQRTIFGVSQESFWFALLLSTHTVLLLLADLTGAKLVEIPHLNLVASVGFITYGFSVVVLLSIRELFGSELAKKTVTIGFVFLIISTIFVTLALHMPPASFWNLQGAYEATLGRLWRLVTFGYISYFIAQNLEVVVFNFLNTFFSRLHRPIRGFISASSTQLLETSLFMTTVFWGTVPSIPKLIAGQFLLKILLLVVSVPLAYVCADKIHASLIKGAKPAEKV